MNCLVCRTKSCRSNQSCGGEKFSAGQILEKYHGEDTAPVIQGAASLVDGGRAGGLSRIEELLEFAASMKYAKVGLAYCYGMEAMAEGIRNLFLERSIPCIGISCTCGAMSQREVNTESMLTGVSCNPLSQAAQMKAEGVDLAVSVGLCMGHDILFQREFDGDQTTLVVKDRVFSNCPVKGVETLLSFPKESQN